MATLGERTTLCYKRKLLMDQSSDLPLFLDIYHPLWKESNSELNTHGDRSELLVPAVIYFHGGGLTVGNRNSWLPNWLKSRVTALGYAFVSADYQLLPPATGEDIVKDIQDVFSFLVKIDIKNAHCTFKINPNAMAVAGSSAGGLCAYLAAMHCVSPKPKAIVSMYGMGGNFLTSHYLQPKTEVFFRGREVLNPADFSEYIYPFEDGALEPISDSPLAYHPQTYHIPGYPANPRMLLARLYLQLGVFLDYYTGQHDPSLTNTLRQTLNTPESNIEDFKRQIPERQHPFFPQFGVDSNWPPTFLLHGTNDTAVPIAESRHMQALLGKAGVPVTLLEFEGKEHSFDYEPEVETILGGAFDEVMGFLRRCLR
ncbi:alpha/beta-hydrolase [Phlegmacium glaucopus]|nr:alpha/beta-hydrolase [Phlegmacium glaucopus]